MDYLRASPVHWASPDAAQNERIVHDAIGTHPTAIPDRTGTSPEGGPTQNPSPLPAVGAAKSTGPFGADHVNIVADKRINLSLPDLTTKRNIPHALSTIGKEVTNLP
jgi:hypothetical protein